MIELNDSYLINKGTNRACYVHPNDKFKCIKVTFSGNNKETFREIKYYKYLKNQNITWDNLAKFYGLIDTNIGEGEVVELIRDYNGNISKELSYYINNKIFLEKHLLDLLESLKTYLENYYIIVKDLNAVNIVYQKYTDTDGRLVIIDGISNKIIITQINFFTKKKISKIWIKFIASLNLT